MTDEIDLTKWCFFCKRHCYTPGDHIPQCNVRIRAARDCMTDCNPSDCICDPGWRTKKRYR